MRRMTAVVAMDTRCRVYSFLSLLSTTGIVELDSVKRVFEIEFSNRPDLIGLTRCGPLHIGVLHERQPHRYP